MVMARQTNIGNRIAPLRFILFFAAMAAAAFYTWPRFPFSGTVLLSFDFAAAVFLLACLPLLNDQADAMRKAARENDANRVILLTLTVILSLVVLVAVADKLATGSIVTASEKLIVAATLLLAWAFANVVYALHYAHLYYGSVRGKGDAGGLDFPGARPEPDYSDFLYFSFTLGIALQTSDVCVTSPKIRRIVLGHCIGAFIYNLGVLALAINILAK